MAAPGPRKPNVKSKKGPEQLAKEFADKDEYAQRKRIYNFGKGKVPIIIPTKYPTPEEADADVNGELALNFSIGYNGSDQTARNNVKVTDDGATLVYHIAAVGVAMDIASSKQRFYFGHNDDVSCLDVMGTNAATGQVDPKDRDGKATPSIHIWDVNTMERQCTISDAAEMQVKCVAWSPNPKSQYLYSLGGDENQAMRMWDIKKFSKNGSPKPMIDNPTCKDEMFGLVFSPNPNPTGERTGTVDEFLMWGRRRAAWGYIKSATVKGNVKIFFQYRGINFGKIMGKGKTENVYLAGAFLPSGHWLVGSPKGNVYIGTDVTPQKKFSACDGFIGALQVLGDGVFCTVSADKQVNFFNVSSGAKQMRQDNSKADMKVTGIEKDDARGSGAITVDGRPDAKLVPRAIAYNNQTGVVYVGSKDNKIISYDFNTKTGGIAMDGHDGDIWGMAACPCAPLFVTAGYDGQLRVIDLATREVLARYEWPLIEEEKSDGSTKQSREAITCCAWSENGKLIAAGTESSKITVFTWLKGVLKMEVSYPVIKTSTKKTTKSKSSPGKNKWDGVEPISYLRFSPCNNFLAAAHYDSNAYMFSVRSMREYAKVELIAWKKPLPHTAATMQLQFSEDSLFLRTFNRNYEVMNWGLNAQKKKAVVSACIPDPDNWTFAHNPLVAGWDVQGLFLGGWDGTDLNDCAVNPDKTLVISGDDFGILRLANYPCVSTKTNIEYQAHSAFVVNCEFSNDGAYAMSCGGGDKAIFGWAVQPTT